MFQVIASLQYGKTISTLVRNCRETLWRNITCYVCIPALRNFIRNEQVISHPERTSCSQAMFLFLQFIRKQDEFRPIVQCRGKKNKVGLKVFLTLEGEKHYELQQDSTSRFPPEGFQTFYIQFFAFSRYFGSI